MAASAGSAGGAAGTAAVSQARPPRASEGALGAKAAVGVATAALITAGAVSVDEVSLDRHDPTAKAGGARISAITGAEDGFGFPAPSRSAGSAVAVADSARRSRPGARRRPRGKPRLCNRPRLPTRGSPPRPPAWSAATTSTSRP